MKKVLIIVFTASNIIQAAETNIELPRIKRYTLPRTPPETLLERLRKEKKDIQDLFSQKQSSIPTLPPISKGRNIQKDDGKGY